MNIGAPEGTAFDIIRFRPLPVNRGETGKAALSGTAIKIYINYRLSHPR